MADRYADAPGVAAYDDVSASVRDLVNFVWRRWKIIAAVPVLLIIFAGLYLSRTTPIYTASAQVLLDPRKERVAGSQDAIMTESVLDLQAMESQMAVIRSSVLLQRVVERQNLVNDPEFAMAPTGSSWSIVSAIRSYFDSSATQSESVVAQTVERLKSAVTVSRAGQAYVITISVNSVDPEKAARLANIIGEAYVVDKLDARFDASKRASAWLSERLEELRGQLRESEQAVVKFRIENNLVQTGVNATLNQEQLAQMNSRLVQARGETAEKKARFDLLNQLLAKGGNTSSMPEAIASPTINALRQQESTVSSRAADLVARYGERHPLVVNVRAELRDVQRGIAEEMTRLSANVRNEYNLALARQEAVEKTLREVTGQTDNDSSKIVTLRELERTAAVNKSLFEDFLQRAKITEGQSSFEARDARIITPALQPGSPSAPRKNLILLMAIAVGLIAGFGAGFLIEFLNVGFTTTEQVETMLNLPVLSSISQVNTRDLKVGETAVPLSSYPYVKPLSRYSEMIRAVRSGVAMTDVDNPPKIVQLTSTIPGEGKSTIALSIATSASQSSLKTLIVDCDFRHPSTSKQFGLEKEIGLVEYLLGTAELKDVIRFDKNFQLYVLPAGGKTQNAADLLASERFKTLLSGLRERFDYIILDSPPLGPVIDPLILSHVTDKIVFVVHWGSTSREMVARTVEQLQGHKKIAGIVLNHVNDQEAQKYGKYAYSHYYGSRYYKNYYSE